MSNVSSNPYWQQDFVSKMAKQAAVDPHEELARNQRDCGHECTTQISTFEEENEENSNARREIH